MPIITLELENDVYTNLISSGVDIEKEFKKFLLNKKVKEHKKIDKKVESKKTTDYWDALDAEIKSIKKLNSKIFTK